MGSLAAPLRYKLIESNLGKDLADTTGYQAEYSETFFSIGLKGVAKENLQKVEDLILDTLKEIIAKKIDPSFIESAIHQKEIDTREIKETYGINLFLNIVGFWMNSGDIIKALSFDEQIKKLGFFLTGKSHRKKILRCWGDSVFCEILAVVPKSNPKYPKDLLQNCDGK